MKKIPTLFVRNPEDRRYVTDEVTSGCEWVLAGEGVATRKYDGTCVMLDDDGQWWARREVKPGKTPPPNWREADHDETTGKRVGWEPIGQSSFAKFHAEAVNHWDRPINPWRPGTYELLGPKINGNPEHTDGHALVRHADADQLGEFTRAGHDGGRDYETVHMTLGVWDKTVPGIEGIVWHHPDGRMVKVKARDFPADPPTTRATDQEAGV